MIGFAGLLAGISVVILFYGAKCFIKPAAQLDRFRMQRYAVDDDPDYKKREDEIREIEKLYKADGTKKILLFIAGAVASGILGYMISGRLHIALAASLFGITVPVAWEKWQADGQKRQIERQFEQAAEQMAMVLKSGGSMQSAVEKAAQEAGYPLKKELELMSAQMKLNVPAAEVFKRAMNRIPVPELDMLVIISSLQQSGMAVNTAAALERIQEGIRARRSFREQISAMTAEGRLTSKIIAVLPFVVLGFMRKIMPSFVEPLFNTTWGLALLVLSVITIFGGLYWIGILIKIDE